MPPLAMVLDMKKERYNRIVKNQYRPRRDIDAIKANLVHQTGSIHSGLQHKYWHMIVKSYHFSSNHEVEAVKPQGDIQESTHFSHTFSILCGCRVNYPFSAIEDSREE